MSKFVTRSPLILASSSAVREKMLRDVGLSFTVIRPKGDEEERKGEISHLPPEEQSIDLAKFKAASVNDIHAGWLVVGADQICVLDGKILGKPGTREKAAEQLKKLSGKTHQQISALALYHQNKCIYSVAARAELTMRKLTGEEIQSYLSLDNALSSCGSYLYEEHGKHLFSTIVGRDDVIMGLPVLEMLNALYEQKFLTFPNTPTLV